MSGRTVLRATDEEEIGLMKKEMERPLVDRA